MDIGREGSRSYIYDEKCDGAFFRETDRSESFKQLSLFRRSVGSHVEITIFFFYFTTLTTTIVTTLVFRHTHSFKRPSLHVSAFFFRCLLSLYTHTVWSIKAKKNVSSTPSYYYFFFFIFFSGFQELAVITSAREITQRLLHKIV